MCICRKYSHTGKYTGIYNEQSSQRERTRVCPPNLELLVLHIIALRNNLTLAKFLLWPEQKNKCMLTEEMSKFASSTYVDIIIFVIVLNSIRKLHLNLITLNDKYFSPALFISMT